MGNRNSNITILTTIWNNFPNREKQYIYSECKSFDKNSSVTRITGSKILIQLTQKLAVKYSTCKIR